MSVKRCCVCGERKHSGTLTYIVPLRFIRACPVNYRSKLLRSSVHLCGKCRSRYLQHVASKTKKIFAGCEAVKRQRQESNFAHNSMRLCKPLRMNEVPEERKQELSSLLYKDWDKKYSIEEIVEICEKSKKDNDALARTYIEELCKETLGDNQACFGLIDSFVMMWHNAFASYMRPRFLNDEEDG